MPTLKKHCVNYLLPLPSSSDSRRISRASKSSISLTHSFLGSHSSPPYICIPSGFFPNTESSLLEFSSDSSLVPSPSVSSSWPPMLSPSAHSQPHHHQYSGHLPKYQPHHHHCSGHPLQYPYHLHQPYLTQHLQFPLLHLSSSI